MAPGRLWLAAQLAPDEIRVIAQKSVGVGTLTHLAAKGPRLKAKPSQAILLYCCTDRDSPYPHKNGQSKQQID